MRSVKFATVSWFANLHLTVANMLMKVAGALIEDASTLRQVIAE